MSDTGPIVAMLSVVFTLAVTAGCGDDGEVVPIADPPATPASTTPAPATAASTTSATTTTPATTAAPPTTRPPLPGFGPGRIVVGADASPGIYQAVVPADGLLCYWERQGDLSGEFESVLANDIGTPDSQVIVEIADTDGAFFSSDCGEWWTYVSPQEPATTFGEGTFIVGQQIFPGRYRSTGPPSAGVCYWERESGVSGRPDDILDSAEVARPDFVDILPTDFSFKSTGCGDWSLFER